MRRFLISIIGVFVVFSAGAVGENIPATKSYVDSALTPKQDIIERTTGANQVLTNTGTAGEYGTKEIYDSTTAYAGQTDALIDAATMNTAVQNAIDSEFKCISWIDDDPTKDCLLMEIRGATERSVFPAGYTALEYIESTGTQWINTGVSYAYSDSGTAKIDIKFDTLSYVGANPYFQISKSGQCLTIGGAPSTCISPYVRNNLIHTWADRISMLYKDGNTLIQQRGWSNYGNAPYRIFYIGNTSQPISSGRIYGLILIKNDMLVRNMIPARRDSDGELGMYDMVNNIFYTNSGTGEFIDGPVVNMNLYMPAGN